MTKNATLSQTRELLPGLHLSKTETVFDPPAPDMKTWVMWTLVGPRCGVSFTIFQCDTYKMPESPTGTFRPYNDAVDPEGHQWMAWGLGTHHRRPPSDYLGRHEDCPVLQGECWSDDSALGAMDLLVRWVKGGQDDKIIEDYLIQVYDNEEDDSEPDDLVPAVP